MKSLSFILRVYRLNLDLDAIVQTNKVNQFCPTVFNEKENARRSRPFEISSCRKISEDICMFRLFPAARPGG